MKTYTCNGIIMGQMCKNILGFSQVSINQLDVSSVKLSTYGARGFSYVGPAVWLASQNYSDTHHYHLMFLGDTFIHSCWLVINSSDAVAR